MSIIGNASEVLSLHHIFLFGIWSFEIFVYMLFINLRFIRRSILIGSVRQIIGGFLIQRLRHSFTLLPLERSRHANQWRCHDLNRIYSPLLYKAGQIGALEHMQKLIDSNVCILAQRPQSRLYTAEGTFLHLTDRTLRF